MLLFVIPLKSRQVSKNWPLVEQLLARTLRSLLQQTSPEFRILVVGHEAPQWPSGLTPAPLEDRQAKLRFLGVDFAPPAQRQAADYERDKARKIVLGVEYALQEGVPYVMAVDADDCLHRGLVDYLQRHPSPSGWCLNQGYIYPEGSRRIYLRSKSFFCRCGSAIIAPADHYVASFIHNDKFMHRFSQLEDGRRLATIHFPAAVYSIAHGDNALSNPAMLENVAAQMRNRGTVAYLRDLLHWGLVTPGLRRTFGLDRL